MSAFGSKGDIRVALIYVRFTPKSGHSTPRLRCLLSAISRHQHTRQGSRLEEPAASSIGRITGQTLPQSCQQFVAHRVTRVADPGGRKR